MLKSYEELDDEESFDSVQIQLLLLVRYRNGLLITYNAYNHFLSKYHIKRNISPIDTKYGYNILQLNTHFKDIICKLLLDYAYIISELIEAFGNISGKHKGDYSNKTYFNIPNHKLFSKYHKYMKPLTFNALRDFDDCMKCIFNNNENLVALDMYFDVSEPYINEDALRIIYDINTIFKAIHREYGINIKELINE